MKPNRRQFLTALWLFAFSLLVTGKHAAAEKLLLPRSHAVEHDASYLQGSQWLSDQEILLIDYPSVTADHQHWQAWRKNILTNRRTSLPVLARLIEQSGALVPWFYLSPDGRWLAWDTNLRGGGICAATLDGSRYLGWSAGVVGRTPYLQWQSDSRQVIGFTSRITAAAATLPQAFVYSLADTGKASEQRTLPQAFAGCSQWNMRLTADGRVQAPTRTDIPGSIAILSWPLFGEGIPVQKQIIRLPAHGEPEGMAFSVDGSRIAWAVFQKRRVSPNAQALLRVGIWVSQADGSRMQEVGHINIKEEADILEKLQWSPEGKRLSFLYRDTLYTVPVD